MSFDWEEAWGKLVTFKWRLCSYSDWLIFLTVCFLVFQNPTGRMKNCPLIDLEVDSGSELAGTVAPSLLHHDLAALGEGAV